MVSYLRTELWSWKDRPFRKIIRKTKDPAPDADAVFQHVRKGAIELQGGKAKVVRDVFCDVRACLGECRYRLTLKIVEREAEPFDEGAAKKTSKEERTRSPIGSVPQMAIVPGNDERMTSGPQTKSLGTGPYSCACNLRMHPILRVPIFYWPRIAPPSPFPRRTMTCSRTRS